MCSSDLSAIQELVGRMYTDSVVRGTTVASTVGRFYRARAQAPVWTTDNGIREKAVQVVDLLGKAEAEGLTPNDYLVEELRTLAAENTPRSRAAYELLLSEAALRYALDMQGYRIIGLQPAGNFALTMPEKFEDVLARIVGSANPAVQLAAFAPTSSFYTRLRGQLAVYRELEAKSTPLPALDAGPTIEPGMRDGRVQQLRARLAAADKAVKAAADDARLYDANLVEGVKRFQAQQGLTADGKVGEKTRNALNRSAKDRVEQITLALDWVRTLPRDTAPAIIINIPEFRVRVMEGETEALAMDVVIGRSVRPTPVFSSKVTAVIYNPSWQIGRAHV